MKWAMFQNTTLFQHVGFYKQQMSLRPSVKKVTWGSAIRHGVTKQNKAVNNNNNIYLFIPQKKKISWH